MNHYTPHESGPNPIPDPYRYGGQPGPYPVPPEPPRRKKHTGAKIFAALAVLAVLMVGSCTALVATTAQDTIDNLPNTVPVIESDTPRPSTSIKATSQPPKGKETVPSFVPRDGVLLVPSEVKPGTYRAVVPASELGPEMPVCYVARLSGTSGEIGDIISNQNRKPGDVVTLTIKAGDDAVEIRGCGTWKRIR